ncbi:MAG TPA: lysylphosphatidylglycerol synthase domain-containing protein, partial [Chloroflexia bacterium]|nr:lysylphosphatidylglycerol synthase domain-containing protein [Chloroflexia bacterium]
VPNPKSKIQNPKSAGPKSKIQNPQSAGDLVRAGGWTALSFLVSTARVWLLAEAIGLALDPAQIGGLVGLTTVAALIPISVSGVGTRDATMVALLSQLVQPPAAASAVAIALSTLILGLNIANAVFGYAVWWIEARTGRPVVEQAAR